MLGDIGDTIFTAAVVAVGIALLVNAVVLAGALVAAIRSDHRNPVPWRGEEWYRRHWDRDHPAGY